MKEINMMFQLAITIIYSYWGWVLWHYKQTYLINTFTFYKYKDILKVNESTSIGVVLLPDYHWKFIITLCLASLLIA